MAINEITSEREKVKTMSGLSHLAIFVADIDRSIRFYTDMFRIDAVKSEKNLATLHTPGSDDRFVLIKANGPITPSGIAHFGFRVDDSNYDRAMDYIRRNGIATESAMDYIRRNGIAVEPPQTTNKNRLVFIRDPDGYTVQIYTGIEG